DGKVGAPAGVMEGQRCHKRLFPAAHDAKIDLSRTERDLTLNEAGQVQVDFNVAGSVDDQRQTRCLVSLELRCVEYCIDHRLRARRNISGPDADLGAAALRPPVGDVDLLVETVNQTEGVEDLRSARDCAEIV